MSAPDDREPPPGDATTPSTGDDSRRQPVRDKWSTDEAAQQVDYWTGGEAETILERPRPERQGRPADEQRQQTAPHRRGIRYFGHRVGVGSVGNANAAIAGGQKIVYEYELERLLSTGGFSWIYLARQRDEALDKKVVVKVLGRGLQVDDEAFRAEAQTLALLGRQPRIIDVYAGRTIYGIDRDGYNYAYRWLAMPYAEGGSLEQRLKAAAENGQKLPLPDIAQILDQVAEALDYAHEHDRVHRDIKPGNILFDDQGHVLLSDFGIALDVSDSAGEPLYRRAGTPPYMAPEQVAGIHPGDERSDIYSLGVVLYRLLTGELPFVAETLRDLQTSIINDPVPSVRRQNAQLPRAVERVINKALDKDPFERYESAGELARDFRSAIGRPIRTLLALAAVVIVVLGAAAVFALSVQADQQEQAAATRAQATAEVRLIQANSTATAAAATTTAEAAAMAESLAQETRRAVEAAAATAEAEAAITATWDALPRPTPGAYPQTDKAGQSELVETRGSDGTLLRSFISHLRIDAVDVQADGSLVVHVTQWIEYPFIDFDRVAAYELVKESDRDKTAMYLSDDLGNRYDYFDVGGDADREVRMLIDSEAVGWFHFPAPTPGATSFTFHVPNEGYEIGGIDLGVSE